MQEFGHNVTAFSEHEKPVKMMDQVKIGNYQALHVKATKSHLDDILSAFKDKVLNVEQDTSFTFALPTPHHVADGAFGKAGMLLKVSTRASKVHAKVSVPHSTAHAHKAAASTRASHKSTHKASKQAQPTKINKQTAKSHKKTTSKSAKVHSKATSTSKKHGSTYKSAKNAATTPASTYEANAPWNLLRISNRRLTTRGNYVFGAKVGSGVTVYVIDDGVYVNHVDFGGRTSWSYSVYGAQNKGGGHRTHVAGIIAGKKYGVAKKAKIVSVQVLNEHGQGTVSGLIKGIGWAMQHAQSGKSVINMSLGIPKTYSGARSLANALNQVAKQGLPMFAAAGNSGTNACDYLPAGDANVFTLGSIDDKDQFDSVSCFGQCVSALAPGVNVVSDYFDSTTSTASMSGTSMASPHAAGVAALVLSERSFSSQFSLYKYIQTAATSGQVKNVPSKTPNRIVYHQA